MATKDFKATAMSGSLTRLTTGETYLIAGQNITIVTGSDDRVTVSGTAGGITSGSFNVPTPANFVTTASLSVAGEDGVTASVSNIGTDVYFYVSGSKSSVVPRGGETGKIAVFGGDLVVSGTLYAERQVIEVDETVDGDFLVSGSAVISKELTIKGAKGVGAYAAGLHFDGATHSAIVWDTGDAAIYESSGGLFLNADSKVMIMSGGSGLSNDEAAATDVSFYVSGAQGSHNELGRLRGTALFGGDVVMSGSLYVRGSEDDGVTSAAITLNSNARSSIVWDSGPDSLQPDASIYESGEELVLSGAKGIKFQAGQDPSANGHLYITGSTDNGSAVVYVNPGTEDIDFRAYTENGAKLQVDAGTDTILVRTANGGTGDLFRVIQYSTWDYDIFTVSTSETVVNEDSISNHDFRVETNTKTHALFVDAGTDQVLILSGGSGDSSNEAAGADVAFYVSGSVGSKGTSVKGTTLFGGDMQISGALHIAGTTDVYESGESVSIILNSRPDVASTSRIVWDTNTDGAYAPDAQIYETGGDLYLSASDDVRIRGEFGDVVVECADDMMMRPGDRFTITEDSAASGKFVEVYAQPSAATFHSVFDIDGSNGIIINDAGESAYDFRVETNNKTHALFTDAGTDQVLILSGGSGNSSNEATAADVNFYVSGSVGSAGTATRGTALFGGDVIISGSLMAKQTEIVYGEYLDSSGALKEFLPLQSSASELTSPNLYTQIVMPFKGRLRKVMLRSTLTPGSTIVGFHKASDGSTVINALSPTETQTINMSVADTSYVFTFFSSTYNEGDIIGFSVDPTTAHGAVNFSIVLENEVF